MCISKTILLTLSHALGKYKDKVPNSSHYKQILGHPTNLNLHIKSMEKLVK